MATVRKFRVIDGRTVEVTELDNEFFDYDNVPDHLRKQVSEVKSVERKTSYNGDLLSVPLEEQVNAIQHSVRKRRGHMPSWLAKEIDLDDDVEVARAYGMGLKQAFPFLYEQRHPEIRRERNALAGQTVRYRGEAWGDCIVFDIQEDSGIRAGYVLDEETGDTYVVVHQGSNIWVEATI